MGLFAFGAKSATYQQHGFKVPTRPRADPRWSCLRPHPPARSAGCGLVLAAALIPALQGKAVRHQCRVITLIWHPAQAAPDRETSVFDQAIAGDVPVPNATVTAYSEATPASGNEALIALWLDGRPTRDPARLRG